MYKIIEDYQGEDCDEYVDILVLNLLNIFLLQKTH